MVLFLAKQIITLYHAAQKSITKDQHALAEIDRSMSFRGDQYISFSLPANTADSDIRNAVSRIMSA
ncbi:hypothetical protein GL180_18325 [Vibrio toranzoniae]|nr:hypothetical protein [Vibrio toranzoniae]